MQEQLQIAAHRYLVYVDSHAKTGAADMKRAQAADPQGHPHSVQGGFRRSRRGERASILTSLATGSALAMMLMPMLMLMLMLMLLLLMMMMMMMMRLMIIVLL